MKKLIRIEYDNHTNIVSMSEREYEFKKDEDNKIFPVSIKGKDLKHPDSFIFYYEYKNKNNKFNEAKNYFYSLDIDFDNCNYLELQKHSIKINKN